MVGGGRQNATRRREPFIMITRRSFTFAGLALAASSRVAEAERICIGQIGSRHAHAAGKMQSIRGLPELYEVAGISDVEPASGETYEGLRRLSTAELLALPQLKVVTVETAIELSCASAQQAIAAGKHVHLDKPGGLAHEEFSAMRREAEKRGLLVQMGYMLRHNPAFEYMVKAVRSGWLGEITEIDAMMGKLANASTRESLAQLPGGGMFELGCHLVDAVLTLMGKPQEVVAFSTPSGAAADGLKDNQLAVFTYPKATATLRCNHVDPFGGPRRRFSITGTKGSMEIMPLESGRMIVRVDEPHEGLKKGEQSLVLEAPKDRYAGEFITLAKCIRGQMEYPWSAQHDIDVHETVLKACGEK